MNAAWAGVLVAAAVASAGAIVAVARLSARWARIETRLDELASDLRQDHQQTNSRLTWLERQIVWRLGTRPPGRDDTDH